MLLRTRISLILLAAFGVFVGLAALVLNQRADLADDHVASVIETVQMAIWDETVGDVVEDLSDHAGHLAATPGFATALGASDPDVRRAGLDAILAEQGMAEAVRADIVTPAGILTYTSAEAVFDQPVLPPTLLEPVLREGRVISGVGHDPQGGIAALVATPVVAPGEDTPVGALVLARNLSETVRDLAGSINADVLIVNRRGRLLEGTAGEDWAVLAPALDTAEERALAQAWIGDRHVTATSTPILGPTGEAASRLITVLDDTAVARSQNRIDLASAGVGLAFVVITLSVVFVYLRRSFAPLELVIGNLDAIARGDTAAMVTAERTDDEVGRIVDGVAAFRENMIALERLKRGQSKQRRRRERAIRWQLTQLANTLEAEPRQAILEDLEAIEAATREAEARLQWVGADRLEDSEALGMATLALEKLTDRIAGQQRRLSELVDELREALQTKTAFIALQQELDIAHRIQMSGLPSPLPPHPAYRIAGRMETAKEVGGDFYDFFPLADGRLAIVVADVSDKGIPAAFFMATTKTSLKTLAQLTPSPAACLARLNALLAEDNDQMMFVTLFYGVFDPQTRTLIYVNGGHPPPLRRASDGTVAPLHAPPSLALAVDGDAAYEELRATLDPGETLVLYSDGLTEATAESGDLFGEDRLAEALAGADFSDGDPSILAGELIEAAHGFEGHDRQADDMTCVVLNLSGGDR